MLPCISIKRHEAGVYEWALLDADERLDGDIGDTAIVDCLKSAIASLHLDVRLIELRYRGVPMGTVTMQELAERPDLVAERIAESYAVLF